MFVRHGKQELATRFISAWLRGQQQEKLMRTIPLLSIPNISGKDHALAHEVNQYLRRVSDAVNLLLAEIQQVDQRLTDLEQRLARRT